MGEGGGYSAEFYNYCYMEKLFPEDQPLTLYTIFDRKATPFVEFSLT